MNKNFGLNDLQLKIIKSILDSFLKPYKNINIFVFGSRSLGTEKKYSDIDLWIDSSPILTVKQIAQLSEIFEESDLSIHVDIISDKTCFESYRNRILKERVLWDSVFTIA